ncbi:MAG: hypothetical protein RI885_1642 [Actinomycetota bacterium]
MPLPPLLAETGSVVESLAGGEFSLVFQPIVQLPGARVVGAEALLRWTHPIHGQVSPADFIPEAERTGAVESIGQWVLEHAIGIASRWVREPGSPQPYLTVNVSGVELTRPGYAESVFAVCARLAFPVDALRLELIESFLDLADAVVVANLVVLRSHGVALLVDDFGTGFSDRERLAATGATAIKIDRTLVASSLESDDAALHLARILHCALEEGIEVIAEGVETLAEAEWLAGHGCRLAQGFLFSPGLDAAALDSLIPSVEAAS